MKRTLTSVLCLTLWLVAGAYAGEPNDIEYEPGIVISVDAADQADNYTRILLGYETKYRFEIGGAIKIYTADFDGSDTPREYGFYFRYHINEFLKIDDPEPDNPFEMLLHHLVGRPYIELDILYNRDSKKIRPDFPIGTLFTVADDPNFKVALDVSYTFGDSTPQNYITIGLRMKI